MSENISNIIKAIIEVSRQDQEAARERMSLLKRLADLADSLVVNEQKQAAEKPPAEQPISSREARILETVGDQRIVGEQIARLLDLEYSGSFKACLSQMVKARLLNNHSRNGYSKGTRADDALAVFYQSPNSDSTAE